MCPLHTHTQDFPGLLHAGLHGTSLHMCLCTLMPTEKTCTAPSCTPHMLTTPGARPTLVRAPGRAHSPLGPHPDNHLPSVPGTHTTLMQSPFYTLHIPGRLNAGSSTHTHIHTHTRTHTRAHTCSHTTITPRSLDPQLPQLRAARPDGPGGSWWGKMSSGCPDGRSHTGT